MTERTRLPVVLEAPGVTHPVNGLERHGGSLRAPQCRCGFYARSKGTGGRSVQLSALGYITEGAIHLKYKDGQRGDRTGRRSVAHPARAYGVVHRGQRIHRVQPATRARDTAGSRS